MLILIIIAISKLVEIKNSSKYLIGYLDEGIRPLVLILPRMSGYVKTFKSKDGDKDKKTKLMTFRIDDHKLLEKYKTISTKIEDRYIKTKIRTYGDNVYSNFCCLNEPKDGVEFETFTTSSIASLVIYESKYYLQVYLDKNSYKIANMKMTDYLDDNLFETDEN